MKMHLFHRPRPAEQLRVVTGVTRAGTVGIGIYRDGRLVAWGRTVSAAWESLRVSEAA